MYCIKCVCQQIYVELSEGSVLITKRISPSTFVVDVFVGVSSFIVSPTRYFGSWKTVRSFRRLRVPLRVRESVRNTHQPRQLELSAFSFLHVIVPG